MGVLPRVPKSWSVYSSSVRADEGSKVYNRRNCASIAARCGVRTEPLRRPLLAVCFAFNQLSEISFRFDGAFIFAVLVALLNDVQYPLNGTSANRNFSNFELAG
jgi:hypothetical protein